MPLIMVPYASRAELPFPECTRLLAADEHADLIALAWHDGYIGSAERAVYAGHRRHGVGIYDARTRALLARLHTAFPTNAIALHPTRDEVALATGKYDGGYFFEGQLLVWNWRTGAWHSELRDNREVKRVSWHGDDLTVVISPATDEDPPGELMFALIPARAGDGAGWQPDEPQDGDPRLDPALGRLAPVPAPSSTLEHYRPLVAGRSRVTAIQWLADGRVAIGDAAGTLRLWEPATDRTRELRVETAVVAMWRHPDHELLLQVDAGRTRTTLCALAGETLEVVAGFASQHSCSVDRHGRILARSLSEPEGHESRILERDGRVAECALGHHDAFNHFIRLDGGDELYFLQGTPPTSHENKYLCALTASGAIERRMPWDGATHHAMSGIGTLVGVGRLARGFLIHNSGGTERGMIELCDLRGHVFWRHGIA
ncbi:MAG: hypothetical protein ABI678_26025, partial [Kofleriaceae bacterium]